MWQLVGCRKLLATLDLFPRKRPDVDQTMSDAIVNASLDLSIYPGEKLSLFEFNA